MPPSHLAPVPQRSTYDVVIVGGAIMGSSLAFFLAGNPDFTGSILVVERDPSYEACSTAHTNSCIRQQFSAEINIRCSQFAAEFIKNLPQMMDGDPRVPNLSIQSFGYLYLAADDAFADALRQSHKVQRAAGAGTRLLSREEIGAAFPFYALDDIVLGSHNPVDEGYWDGSTVFDWLHRKARERGAEYVANEVTAITLDEAGTRVTGVTLRTGERIACGTLVNASGPRAARTATMAGLEIPVEPRKRFTYVFRAERPLDRELPLTIDPSGVHVREVGGGTYQAGGHAMPDPCVEPDDFAMDPALWQDHIWPAVATRIPQFEAVKVIAEWAGHYAYNTLDHNAILGPHERVRNFHFMNGFSGHGLQQAPAMGRGLHELITYGEFRTLDLSPFGYERIAAGRPFLEAAVI